VGEDHRQLREVGGHVVEMLAAVHGSDQRHLVVLPQDIVADQLTRADG
jgi:hypothetical protein